MHKKIPGKFMLSKIEELQSALFFSETPDRIIPTCILQQVQIDEQANIWFVIPCPPKATDAVNESFPCRMDFFRKGADFHMKINGVATITSEQNTGNNKQLMVKVKIQKTQYFEIPPVPAAHKKNSSIGTAVQQLFALFF